MRFLLRWTVKLSVMGGFYFAFASGAVHVTLPATVLGLKVPVEAQQFVDHTAKIAEYGQQTQESLKQVNAGLR